MITVYSAKMKDGTCRVVEAVSWKDCKRYLGSKALIIRKTSIPIEQFHRCAFHECARQEVFDAANVSRIKTTNG